ncbi:MAG: nickel pincer cofactor-dependent isomerase, group 22 [Chloroflexota bacterium]
MNPSISLDYPRSPMTPEIAAAVTLPRVMKVRHTFTTPEVTDIAAAVKAELDRVGLAGRFGPGAKVAITCGSRGISSIPQVAAAIVAEVRRLGGEPFIVPSMGSHGGATAEGQTTILKEIGVTEEAVGAPVRATMEVVELGKLERGMPVYMDKYAAEADAIILLNRIKTHSPWGHIGSGLMKVCAIGLGKQVGCNTIHAWTVGTNQVYYTIQECYELARKVKPIVLGVGILDNAYARPARIVALTPEEMPELEPGLRREAAQLVAKLPWQELDVLVLDEMGKNTSPGGVDPLVVGRPKTDPAGNPIPNMPNIKKVVVLSLTPQSHGNSIGLGNADVTTRRLASQIDFYAMYMNSISACAVEGVRVPMVMPSDKEAIQIAALSCGMQARQNLRLVRSRSTLKITDLYISEALVPTLKELAQVEQMGELEPLAFDDNGNLF